MNTLLPIVSGMFGFLLGIFVSVYFMVWYTGYTMGHVIKSMADRGLIRTVPPAYSECSEA